MLIVVRENKLRVGPEGKILIRKGQGGFNFVVSSINLGAGGEEVAIFSRLERLPY